jgi:hypothetical protein
MPNYCDNELYVSITKSRTKKEKLEKLSTLKHFMNHVRGDETAIDFDKIIPYPKKFKDMDKAAEKSAAKGNHVKDGYNSGGYEWCISFWGTKWNADASLEHTDLKKGKLRYGMSTVWSPPTPVILKMSEMFPGLQFKLKYWEGGNGFKGIFIAENGEIISDESDSYSGYRGG